MLCAILFFRYEVMTMVLDCSCSLGEALLANLYH